MSDRLRVEFGAGGCRLPGWVHHDQEVDITKPLPYAEGTVDQIKAEHVVEHVTPAQALHFFDECYRILKPGGWLRVCVPSISRVHALGGTFNHIRDLICGHGHLAVYDHDILHAMLTTARFNKVYPVARDIQVDHHWRVIGPDKDDLETIRMEAMK